MEEVSLLFREGFHATLYTWVLSEVKVLCLLYNERLYLVEEFGVLAEVLKSLFANVGSLEPTGLYLSPAFEKHLSSPLEGRVQEII
jgi:hypothetical protein